MKPKRVNEKQVKAKIAIQLTPQQVADVLTALAEWTLIESGTRTGGRIVKRMGAAYATIAKQVNLQGK